MIIYTLYIHEISGKKKYTKKYKKFKIFLKTLKFRENQPI